MVQVFENLDEFIPTKVTGNRKVEPGITVWQYLQEFHPKCKTEYTAFIIQLNGKPLLRRLEGDTPDDWSNWEKTILLEGDQLHIVSVHGLVEAIVALVVAVAVAVVAIAITPKPTIPAPKKVPTPNAPLNSFEPAAVSSGAPEAAPVFSLTGQKNQSRYLQAIESGYGRFRHFPSYAAIPYNTYDRSTEQFQFSLFSLGQGEFDIEAKFIEDTPMENFDEVEDFIYGPNEPPTFFSSVVETSGEVGGIELFGPNQSEYDGFVGPFVANQAFTRVNKLEFDVSYPSGLYNQDKFTGNLIGQRVNSTFQYRAIDDNGTPLEDPGEDGEGGWIVARNFNRSDASATPKRFTISISVPLGRYEVRARRTNSASNDIRVADTFQWDALRAFQPDNNDYGAITLWAVKARASNNLNNNSANKFNIVATRKLPIYEQDSEGNWVWSEPRATRNPIWALCDVARNKLYGGGLEDDQLDLETFVRVAAEFETEGIAFDWVFDQKTSIWEVFKVIARSCRSTIVFESARLSIKRDLPATVPVAVFTQDNIIRGSFKRELALASEEDGDGVIVEYVDPVTWKSETVNCFAEGDIGIDADKVKLPGVTDRTRAFHEGMYMRNVQIYNRENISFSTGLEGLIPSFGDLIAISHDVPRWGTAGIVLGIDGHEITLSDEFVFPENAEDIPRLLIKDRFGLSSGPYLITPGDSPTKVITNEDIEGEFSLSGNSEAPIYLIGSEDRFYKLAKVTKINPSGEEEVKIETSAYDERVYSGDLLEPPIRTAQDGSTLSVPKVPNVTGLNVIPVAGSIKQVIASWRAVFGISTYSIETSYDGVEYDPIASTDQDNYTLDITPGMLYVRVAAVNQVRGAWATWQGQVGEAVVPPLSISSLTLNRNRWDTNEALIYWPEVDGAEEYEVTVINTEDSSIRRVDTTTKTEYDYDIVEALQDGAPSRYLTFSVVARNSVGDSETPATIDIFNDFPPVPSGLNIELISNTTDEFIYRVDFSPSTELDLAGYRVWASISQGFSPGAGNLVYEGPVSQADVTISSPGNNGQHPAYYFRFAAFDIWGESLTGANPYQAISSEQVIPAVT